MVSMLEHMDCHRTMRRILGMWFHARNIVRNNFQYNDSMAINITRHSSLCPLWFPYMSSWSSVFSIMVVLKKYFTQRKLWNWNKPFTILWLRSSYVACGRSELLIYHYSMPITRHTIAIAEGLPILARSWIDQFKHACFVNTAPCTKIGA